MQVIGCQWKIKPLVSAHCTDSTEPIMASHHIYVYRFAYLCDFNPELWQFYRTTLAVFRITLGFCSLIECYTSETQIHDYAKQQQTLTL
jgi:hypothetical protein